jgi:tetratricopeptide (TPR) repeat protein
MIPPVLCMSTFPTGLRRHIRARPWLIFLAGCCGLALPAGAAEIAEAEQLFRAGKYEACAAVAAEEVENRTRLEDWPRLKALSELAQGKDEDAAETIETAVRRFPFSIAMSLLAHDVYKTVGRDSDAVAALDGMERTLTQFPPRYITPENRLVIGRFFLLKGADARKVLNQCYDVALKQDPQFVPAHLATAELALLKQDDALAAQTLQKAPKAAAQDPRYHYLLAQALSSADRSKSEKAIAEALKINPNHVDSLLVRADHEIDDERYDEAEKVLAHVLGVNPKEPRAWALRAVLAHLRNDPAGETSAREKALARSRTNPEVDHVIGRNLSRKYRFAEGSAYQKKSLALQADYQPAKVQLCQDMLRLGEEAEGWTLADDIFKRDAYNVVAFNLVTLRDRIAGFRTIESDGLILRMDPREADLYGPRALELLKKARTSLCTEYGVTLTDSIIVEIFPQRKEFAVRTFGLPGADGLLGVCFGRVVTAISPAAQGANPSNWESVLWHEFCHVVTLHKSRNKMPRWLSEGISVHEEAARDPACATALNPKFRAMILGKDLAPLSKLSSAFLTAESSLALQFAYFESSLAVDFLVAKSGKAALSGLLDDLGMGLTINEALPGRTKTSLDQLDKEFAQFARKKAEALAPEATWDEPEDEELPSRADSKTIAEWLLTHPKNVWGLRRLAARLVTEEKWDTAKTAALQLKSLYPEYTGPENAYMLLAAIHRHESDPKAERAVLEELALRDGDAGPAYLRLMDLDEAASDWKALGRNARRMLAVNPLIPAPHRMLARAAEQVGDRASAIAAYQALTRLDTTDPAELQYHLAKLLRETGRTAEARQAVLRSLEDAPRFLDAHKLLLELVEADKDKPATPPSPPAPGIVRP